MFFSRDTASCQEKSLAAHFSANKPHEDLHYSQYMQQKVIMHQK